MLMLVYICSGGVDLETPWKSKNQVKTKVICHRHGKIRVFYALRYIADLSNEDHNTF